MHKHTSDLMTATEDPTILVISRRESKSRPILRLNSAIFWTCDSSTQCMFRVTSWHTSNSVWQIRHIVARHSCVFCSKQSTVASMLPINNVFNSHTLNPSGCGPEKTKSTLGETKKWALSGNNWNQTLQNLYKLNKDDSDPQDSSILNCSFPCACQVAHYPLQESTDPPN